MTSLRFTRSRAVILTTIKAEWETGLLVALLSATGYTIIVWAFSQERIAPVAVLRETSVLFAVLISVFFIKEAFSPSTRSHREPDSCRHNLAWPLKKSSEISH